MQMLLGAPRWRLTLTGLVLILVAPCAGAEPIAPESPAPPTVPAWIRGLPEPHEAGAPARRGPVAAASAAGAQAIDLALWTEGSAYNVGDILEVSVSVSIACHLTLIDVDRDRRAVVLFPNDSEPDNLIPPGVTVRIPGAVAPYQLRFDHAGPETLIAVCQRRTRQPAGISYDYEKQRFAILGDWGTFLAKAARLENEAKNDEDKRGRRKKTAPPPIDPDGPELEGRAAITVAVDEAAKP
jgi:Domain of unknown function (DUF4384)